VSNSWCTDKVFDLADALRYCFAAWRIAGLVALCEHPPNGVDGWQIDKEPTLMFSPKEYPEEIWVSRIRASHSCPNFNKLPGHLHLLFPWRPGASLALIWAGPPQACNPNRCMWAILLRHPLAHMTFSIHLSV